MCVCVCNICANNTTREKHNNQPLLSSFPHFLFVIFFILWSYWLVGQRTVYHAAFIYIERVSLVCVCWPLLSFVLLTIRQSPPSRSNNVRLRCWIFCQQIWSWYFDIFPVDWEDDTKLSGESSVSKDHPSLLAPSALFTTVHHSKKEKKRQIYKNLLII